MSHELFRLQVLNKAKNRIWHPWIFNRELASSFLVVIFPLVPISPIVKSTIPIEKPFLTCLINVPPVVNIGEEINYKIVCGAPNVKEGQKVVVAKPDTVIYPINREPFKIKKAKIRGEESFGMICAKDEIGLKDDHEGIIVLDSSAEIGTTAAKYFNIISDTIFEIGLTPNRADAMSHYGVARDLMVGLKFKKLISSNTNLKDLPKKSELTFNKNDNIQINIENPKLCYRYSGIIIKNINVKPSPIWLKEKLESIGLKPINNIVDITNYTLHLYGQPLHAFDLDKISTFPSSSNLVWLVVVSRWWRNWRRVF